MLYMATPSSQPLRDAMSAGLIGCMTTPAQGNLIPTGALYACDNGRFGKGWPGHASWHAWLTATVQRYGAGRCLWAVAPDIPFDSAATLAESTPWLPRIQALGIPAAFAAQDGSEAVGMVPWDDLDVLFLGGTTEWKTGPAARRLTAEALTRGKQVHMGRVNSARRFALAEDFGCSTVDGTCTAMFPDVYLPEVIRWSAGTTVPGRIARHAVLFDLPGSPS